MKNLLPIGSVVLLKDTKKRLMICGRIQTNSSTGATYDYSACYYPEGIINSDELFLFNNDDIQLLYYVGMQDEEEFKLRAYINEKLDGNDPTNASANSENEDNSDSDGDSFPPSES